MILVNFSQSHSLDNKRCEGDFPSIVQPIFAPFCSSSCLHFGLNWVPFCIHFGIILAPFGSILGQFCLHFASLLSLLDGGALFWYFFDAWGSPLGPVGDHFDSILRSILRSKTNHFFSRFWKPFCFPFASQNDPQKHPKPTKIHAKMKVEFQPRYFFDFQRNIVRKSIHRPGQTL